MRDEMLKKLDEFVAAMVHEVDEEWGPWDDPNDNWVGREWTPLHAELAAERCENCRWWGIPVERMAHTAQLRSCRELGRRTSRNFGCSHFTKKE